MKQSGMMLIFLYVYENDVFNSVEINFSNNYFVSFENEERSKIRIEKLVGEESSGKSLYSNYIKNISVFVGVNGIGKTSLLNYLGFQDAKVSDYYNGVSYFTIYEMEGNLYFEGMEGEEAFIFFDEDYERHGNRYWARVMYDETKGRLSIVHDQSMDFLFPDIQDEYDKIQYFYYQDNLPKGIGWIEDEFEKENNNNSVLKRDIIQNTIYDIYQFLNNEKFLVQYVLKNRNDMRGYLILNTKDGKRIKWGLYEKEDRVKSFIVQLLFNLCEEEHQTKDSNELKKIQESLIPQNDNQLPKITDYEYYKKKLIDIYIQTYDYNEQSIRQVVQAIENLDVSYFMQHKNIWVKTGTISAEIIDFGVMEEYDEKLYYLLELISTFNDNLITYQLFNYKYDSMSAGEVKCIDIFSGVCQSIKKRGKELKNKNIVLLLDEPDKGLHPELSRKFISILNSFSEELGKQYNCTFQYIITSHSPFLILDILESNIYMLRKEDEGKTEISKGNMGIMSNIADLIKDTFFLESPFGVLSESYFKIIQNDILNLKEGYSKESVDDISKRIELINEISLRSYLVTRLENQLESICPKNELLKYYQKRIEELKKND